MFFLHLTPPELEACMFIEECHACLSSLQLWRSRGARNHRIFWGTEWLDLYAHYTHMIPSGGVRKFGHQFFWCTGCSFGSNPSSKSLYIYLCIDVDIDRLSLFIYIYIYKQMVYSLQMAILMENDVLVLSFPTLAAISTIPSKVLIWRSLDGQVPWDHPNGRLSPPCSPGPWHKPAEIISEFQEEIVKSSEIQERSKMTIQKNSKSPWSTHDQWSKMINLHGFLSVARLAIPGGTWQLTVQLNAWHCGCQTSGSRAPQAGGGPPGTVPTGLERDTFLNDHGFIRFEKRVE